MSPPSLSRARLARAKALIAEASLPYSPPLEWRILRELAGLACNLYRLRAWIDPEVWSRLEPFLVADEWRIPATIAPRLLELEDELEARARQAYGPKADLLPDEAAPSLAAWLARELLAALDGLEPTPESLGLRQIREASLG